MSVWETFLHMSYAAIRVDKMLSQNILIDEMHLAIEMPFSPQWLQRKNMALNLHINICNESHACSSQKNNWAWFSGKGLIRNIATWRGEFTNIMSCSIYKPSYIILAASYKSRSRLLDKLSVLWFSRHHMVNGVCVRLLPFATPTKVCVTGSED